MLSLVRYGLVPSQFLLILINLHEYLCILAWREGYFGRFMSSVLAIRVGGYSARLLDMHSDFGCVHGLQFALY